MSTQPSTNEKTVGVIGGMGPAATVDLMQRVIAATPADDDSDHIHMIVDNNPKIPSRLKALLDGGGENPGPHIAAMARRLEQAGADFLVIPCNTAHYYRHYAVEAVVIPVWDMLDLTAKHIAERLPEGRIGILASTAVQRIHLFEPTFEHYGVEAVFPEDEPQDIVLATIRAVKRGPLSVQEIDAYNGAIARFEQSGVDGLLLACTELSVIAPQMRTNLAVFDSLQLLADEIVRHVNSFN